MWLTLVVFVVSAVFLIREARAVQQGYRSRRQFWLRSTGCALLLTLAVVLQFTEAILLPAGAAGGGARLLRLLQFSTGVFVLIVALVLIALLDVRETLQRYLLERKQIIDELVSKPSTPSISSDGKHGENPS
ncbi:MAG: hypothetical protein RMM08_01395 [Armatimonadota bacterium]|nr:hypothetical protein [bacterium]MDW8319991.1 hypothetical protein [Armatimonadota bacterium]